MKRLKNINEWSVLKESSEEKYIITAQAFDPNTGAPMGESRDEEIDIKTNEIFINATSIMDIHDMYENFWNKLNDSPKEIIFVQKIVKK